MKKLLIVLFSFCMIHQSVAQLIDISGYNAINYNADSTLVVLQIKKKQCLFNLVQGVFEIDFCKSRFEYLPGSNCFLQIDPKQNCSIHLMSNNRYISVFEKDGEAYIHFPHPIDETEAADVININGLHYNGNSERVEFDNDYVQFDWSRIGLKKISPNLLLINNYRNEAESWYEEGMDLNRYGEEYYKSGIYNKLSNSWTIAPQYQKCFQLNNYIFCLRKNLILRQDFSNEIFFSKYEYSYDIYKFEGDNVSLEFANVKTNGELQVAKLLNVDAVESANDKTHFITTKNSKNGFVRFQLFDRWEPQTPRYLYQELVPISADFIGFSSYYKKLYLVYSDSTQRIQLYHFLDGYESENGAWKDEVKFIAEAKNSIEFFDRRDYLYDDDLVLLNQSEINSVEMDEEGNFNLSQDEDNSDFSVYFGVQLFNDTIVVYTNYADDELSGYVLLDSYGDDSLDVDGNVVFETYMGFEKSGIYSLNQQKWVLPKASQIIYATGVGYLIRNIFRNAETNFMESENYSFIGFDGEEKFRNIKSEDIITTPNYLKYCVKNYEVDSLFDGPGGFYKHNQLADESPYHYYLTGKNIGLFSPLISSDFIAPDWQTDAKDFVHANRDVDFVFWIENDSIHLKTQHGTVVAPIGNIKLNYLQNMNDTSDFDLTSAQDSIYTNYNVINNIDLQVAYSSFEIKGDLLIINDQHMSDLSCIECMDFDGNGYDEELIIQTENAAVWKNINGSWQKMTPYYATIHPVDNGSFIVSTGYFHRAKEFWTSYNAVELSAGKNIDERYLLLDSNFNAMHFVDYFDFKLISDLGFGYKICLDSGCFFMTYDFQILTDAVWDEFLPTENKNEVNAIRRAVYTFDEFGDFVYDENGNWKEEKPEVSEIIKLP